MYLHIFVSRLKCLIHDRQTLFWSSVFPLVMATLFGLAFSDINKGEAFVQIPVAVVDNAAYRSNTSFSNALNSSEISGKKMFRVNLCDRADAEKLVDSGTVAGAIELDENGGVEIIVKNSGYRQTVIKSFADTYLQLSSTYNNIGRENPAALHKLIEDGGYRDVEIKEVPVSNTYPDNTMIYYFALIAMACMYGSFQGMNAVSAIQANQSDVAARTNLAPVHKLKVFGALLSAAVAAQYVSILILIAYLRLAIGVRFGSSLGYVLLASAAGCIMGVAFGAMIGALLKRREDTKVAIIIAISMICTFLAGLMYRDMKYIVQKSLPVLSYLNPANLITDAFYVLFFYETHDRYFLNIALLGGFAAVFFTVLYFVLRRQKYASL